LPAPEIRIILDTNVWISYAIGKKMDSLKDVLVNKVFQSYICDELINEFVDVSGRPKIRKYISENRRSDTIKLMKMTGRQVVLKLKIAGGDDPKDFYLLSLAKQIKAQYLITGDRGLLSLDPFSGTRVVNYNEFVKLEI
jgi:putative PIN family toxin of toxin-antitoxin system